ncbi:hypothetical protein BY996DRAFT_526998 [Phakopsora pachyrhizi]|nr:hypothetical protein BY996DRAFT_526998 [Phakopsora pachyrhizi]
MPFGEKYWRANMSQGIPLIKLNTGARISYLSAMADISKRFLSLMDYEIRCKKRSSYRLFNIRINEGGGALDDIIIGKIYSDLIAEFCNILKSLDEAVNNNEERYFKFNEVTKAVDDVDIYGWREIAHRLLDSLLIVFPDTQYFHAGKKVAQTVLKDIFILNIVKEQILKHIEYDLNIGREFIDFKSYIRAVTAFDGNLFGELSLKDQYDILVRIRY